jgi:hypothetical protein
MKRYSERGRALSLYAVLVGVGLFAALVALVALLAFLGTGEG